MTNEGVHLINLEYVFRIIYQLLPGAGTGDYVLWLSHFWTLIVGISYIVALVALAILAYCTVRLHQLKEEEEPMYETLEPERAENETEHARWSHVIALIESPSESDWRQSIIEADIMLDDILGTHGYEGSTLAEKLKQGDPARFRTLQDAWDAHKIRNDIAHQGSTYKLTDHIAYRTIGKYKNVFEEFHAI